MIMQKLFVVAVPPLRVRGNGLSPSFWLLAGYPDKWKTIFNFVIHKKKKSCVNGRLISQTNFIFHAKRLILNYSLWKRLLF